MRKPVKNHILLIMQSRLLINLAWIVVLLTACESAAKSTAKPAPIPSSLPPSVIEAAKPDEKICSLLTDEDIGQALGIEPASIQQNSIGKVCTYSDSNMIVTLSYLASGGNQAMISTHNNLGSAGVDVPGLGDQAFYNSNSSNALYVLKGDAEYVFLVSNLNDEKLDPGVVRGVEKSLAEILISKLP
jgi:hypothetical protein